MGFIGEGPPQFRQSWKDYRRRQMWRRPKRPIWNTPESTNMWPHLRSRPEVIFVAKQVKRVIGDLRKPR